MPFTVTLFNAVIAPNAESAAVSLSMMLTVADEFAPSVAPETLLNVTVNDGNGGAVSTNVTLNVVNNATSITNEPAATTGNVSRWSYEEGSGTDVADSVSSHDGNTVGTVDWTTGKSGNGMRFNGGRRSHFPH